MDHLCSTSRVFVLSKVSTGTAEGLAASRPVSKYCYELY